MNTQEQKRVMVLNRILEGHLSVAEAARLLELSPRQLQRILAAYRKEGVAAVVHGNRGRQPKHTIAPQVRQQVIALATGPYAGTNQQHLRDLLQEREGLVLSRASVHRILAEAHLLPEPKHRPPQHRRRRQRYAQEGMLVQIDGSRHAWLGDRGPWLTLLAAIDDATGKILAAVFREQEDTAGYMLLLRQIVQGYGSPLALYHDRHGIFGVPGKASEADSVAEQLKGKQEPTQFARLLEELCISSLAARSPQAKGRVERLFGTLQDRLVVELRLAGACTLPQANTLVAAYLPRFNAQFAVPAAQSELAYRPVPASTDLERLFCFKYVRTVANDNTVSLGEHRLQLLPDKYRRSYARLEVQVHERLDGSLVVYCAEQCVASKSAPAEAPLLRARPARRVSSPQEPTPSIDGSCEQGPQQAAAEQKPSSPKAPGPRHPWRKPLRPSKASSATEGNS